MAETSLVDEELLREALQELADAELGEYVEEPGARRGSPRRSRSRARAPRRS